MNNERLTGREKLCREWILCPGCGHKTRDRIRQDTVLINYPLFCPKCKREHIVNVRQFKVTVIKEPDA